MIVCVTVWIRVVSGRVTIPARICSTNAATGGITSVVAAIISICIVSIVSVVARGTHLVRLIWLPAHYYRLVNRVSGLRSTKTRIKVTIALLGVLLLLLLLGLVRLLFYKVRSIHQWVVFWTAISRSHNPSTIDPYTDTISARRGPVALASMCVDWRMPFVVFFIDDVHFGSGRFWSIAEGCRITQYWSTITTRSATCAIRRRCVAGTTSGTRTGRPVFVLLTSSDRLGTVRLTIAFPARIAVSEPHCCDVIQYTCCRLSCSNITWICWRISVRVITFFIAPVRTTLVKVSLVRLVRIHAGAVAINPHTSGDRMCVRGGIDRIVPIHSLVGGLIHDALVPLDRHRHVRDIVVRCGLPLGVVVAVVRTIRNVGVRGSPGLRPVVSDLTYAGSATVLWVWRWRLCQCLLKLDL